MLGTTFVFDGATLLGGLFTAGIAILIVGVFAWGGNNSFNVQNWKMKPILVVGILGFFGGLTGIAAAEGNNHNANRRAHSVARQARIDLRSEHFRFTNLDGYNKSLTLIVGQCRIYAEISQLPSRHDTKKKWRPTVFGGSTGLEASDLPALAQVCRH